MVCTDIIQFLLAHTVWEGLYTAQFDGESAYLNAPLEEKLYLSPPQVVRVAPGRVLQLRKKTIYSLKQLARAWAEALRNALARCGFQRSEAYPAIYVNRDKDKFVAVYIDDILYVS